jgi:putative addiction module component (TIGR02574 family)
MHSAPPAPIDLATIDLAALPPAERILIAKALLDSVLFASPSSELTPAQLADLHGRIQDVENGRVQTVPWEAARARLWNSL